MREHLRKFLDSLPDGLLASAVESANALRAASRVLVATHIDADGIAAAAIAKVTLERMGKPHDVRFFKKLDDGAIGSLGAAGADLVWFTDLGSGSISKLGPIHAVVTDHHVPDTRSGDRRSDGQALLSDFSRPHHVNPHLQGRSGADELSGAGATLLVAVAVDEENADLSHLAILGSVGDLQDQKTRRLEGLNRDVLALAVDMGLVDAKEDIRYFGRETRPVFKMLEYSSDPFIPRITGREQEAISFLLGLGVELKDGDAWRTWSTMTDDERETVTSALRNLLLAGPRGDERAARLTGETYSLPTEKPGSPVRDVKEYATLLNACGRHGRAEVGLRICAGDRGDALEEGYSLLRDHRSALSQALELAKSKGITRMQHIQYFDAGDEIAETIVGTIAGMLLGSSGADRSAPMVAFADATESGAEPLKKVSARGTQELVAMGLDLSAAMRRIGETVGGAGGGHNIAAGATIPSSQKDEFLRLLDELVGAQLGG
ncbi:MAG: DHH family phosphoesterase [Methanobacteriota archaeon]|nr:MAG: DHH family phosphoesterase [Euryarchaeota archaeon]